MIFVKVRKQFDRAAMSVALLFVIMPAIGLVSGTAFLIGSYSGGYLEADLSNDPDTYWYIILLELGVVLGLVGLALFDFPFIKSTYERVLSYKAENKVIAYIGLYLILPIIVVIFCFILLLIFDA
ncbi:MAG: hypothetical protein V7784_07595 [Oceanospirillaceae bacterium]